MTQWGLDVLFNPAKRHMDEEKRRLQSTREQLGDNSGGKRIDLESGKVTIPRTEGDEAGADGQDSTQQTDRSVVADQDRDERSEADLTPAQLRALQRRGRAPRS
ncbi:hypothetical protein SAMN05443575_1720 [Jatrophihabitans endophyticus]|uniref:Uncharacterized protein n=1 Tax=Jatrophihabitans endophyticus TaxID=1206085 RepID=A0A1M5I270_9ACTN|nr:DUF6191 domain-containing protein [Jatrophihabitans endophyticus]SHG22129.1 hypothetical protein SAMN05443575_1720 [Jatrophihabitans endophyticus]